MPLALTPGNALSLAFLAKETFVPEAITSDDAGTEGNDDSSHLEKRSVVEEVHAV